MTYYTFMPKLLNMTLTASVVICVVLVLRLFLKKAPKAISYALWFLVLFRLLCPISFQSSFSAFSLMNVPTASQGENSSVMEYIPENIVHTKYPAVTLPIPALSEIINETLPQGEEQVRADPLEAPLYIATFTWIFGVAAMLVYSLFSYLGLRRKLQIVVPLRDNIFTADDIGSPFVVGLLRPRIYLPCNLNEKEQEYIILHEQFHIKRLDHIFKAVAFLALAVHWFNPLVWLAFILASKDMEMSCDEAVIGKMGGDIRADYSASLLALATGHRIIAGTPLAFGEGDTADRIKNLSKWKKPAIWITVAAVFVCVVFAVCLLTNPKPGIMSDSSDIISAAYFDGEKEVELPLDAAAALETVINQYRVTPFIVGLDDPDQLSTLVTLNKSDGTFYTVHYQYYSGFSFLHGKEDDYRTIVTKFDATGKAQKAWQMNFAFDKVFVKWRRQYHLFGGTESVSAATKWFDSLNGDEMIWDGIRENSLDEFPGVTFRWHSEKLEAVTDKETIPLYTGMPIWSVYFCDLNGDGKREICSSVSFGSGMIDNRIVVADYANKGVYELSDRGDFDYYLTYRDGQLWVEKRASMQDTVLESGLLMLRSVIGTDGTAVPMLMIGQRNSETAEGINDSQKRNSSKLGADIEINSLPASIDFESMEVGDIVYVGDIAIQKAPDDDDGPSGPVTRSTNEGFEVKSFGGNTSVDKVLNLNSTYRYFYIYIKNTGSNTISVTIGNNSSTQSNNFHEIPTGNYYIWSTNQWAAQSRDVSFSSINGMYGSATAMLCSTLAEAENHKN